MKKDTEPPSKSVVMERLIIELSLAVLRLDISENEKRRIEKQLGELQYAI